jgi:dolichol-phosphate mannosyltransferase
MSVQRIGDDHREAALRVVPPHAIEPGPHPKTLVVIPTFEEATNIEFVLTRIRLEAPWVDIAVVDDNSPDGTADAAERVAATRGRIVVVRRSRKTGLGSAYRTGFGYGLARGYDVLVEMDADLSHDPALLPALLHAVERGADLAIGSRYVPGGSTPHWPARRRALSRGGNAYAAFMLRVRARDLTSGFRAYRAGALRAISYSTTRASGYAFQIELAARLARAGGSIVEVPIAFVDRTRGRSKMSGRICGEALALVTWWGCADLCARVWATWTRPRHDDGAVDAVNAAAVTPRRRAVPS